MGYSGAHFHNAVAGQTGGVFYDLSSMYSNGGIFGYWLDTDPNTMFTAAMSNKFRKDSVYVNIHTMTNMNGEVRGNTSRMLCNAIPQNVSTLGNINVTTKLYPNPTSNNTTLDIISSGNVATNVVVYDVMGRVVWNREKQLESGINRVVIPTESLTAGMYSVQIRSNEGQVSLKLIKN